MFTNRKLQILFLIAFALRLTVFLLYRPWDNQVQTESILIHDANDYHKLALCIIDQFSFCGETFKTPGYPLFIAFIYTLFGVKPYVALFFQIIVNLVTIYYVFKIGELLFSGRVGFIAAIFLAIEPNSIFRIVNLYSDIIFVTFLTAAMYFYFRGLKLGEARGFLIGGLLMAFATLIRPVAQYYFLILLVFTLLWPARPFSTKLNNGFLYGLAFLVAISPWLYHNYKLYDTAKLSTIQGDNLLFWQVSTAKAWETNRPRKVIAGEYLTQVEKLDHSTDKNPYVREKIQQNLAIQYIKTHPQFYASCWLKGVFHTYFDLNSENFIVQSLGVLPTDLTIPRRSANAENEYQRIVNFFQSNMPKVVSGLIELSLLLINYLTFLLGSYILIKRKQFTICAILMIGVLYFAAAGGSIGEVRYRLPISPFYLLVGAVFIDQLLERRTLKSVSLKLAS